MVASDCVIGLKELFTDILLPGVVAESAERGSHEREIGEFGSNDFSIIGIRQEFGVRNMWQCVGYRVMVLTV